MGRGAPGAGGDCGDPLRRHHGKGTPGFARRARLASGRSPRRARLAPREPRLSAAGRRGAGLPGNKAPPDWAAGGRNTRSDWSGVISSLRMLR